MSRHNEFRAAHGVPALTWDPKVEIKREKSALAKNTTINIHLRQKANAKKIISSAAANSPRVGDSFSNKKHLCSQVRDVQ